MGLEHLALNIRIATVLKGSRIRPRLSKAHGANVKQQSIEVMPHGILDLRPSHSPAPHVNSTEHTALTAGTKGVETTEAVIATVLEVSILPCQAMEVVNTLIIDTIPLIEANPPVGVRNMVLDTVLTLRLPISMEFGHCSTSPSLLKGRSHLLAVHKGASRQYISETPRQFHDFQKSPTCNPKNRPPPGLETPTFHV